MSAVLTFVDRADRDIWLLGTIGGAGGGPWAKMDLIVSVVLAFVPTGSRAARDRADGWAESTQAARASRAEHRLDGPDRPIVGPQVNHAL